MKIASLTVNTLHLQSAVHHHEKLHCDIHAKPRTLYVTVLEFIDTLKLRKQSLDIFLSDPGSGILNRKVQNREITLNGAVTADHHAAFTCILIGIVHNI